LYSIGEKYKFEMIGKIYYTGKVIEEDETHVKIFSIRGEELILNKEEIYQAKRIEQTNSIEGEF
jgi:hypothetical protein